MVNKLIKKDCWTIFRGLFSVLSYNANIGLWGRGVYGVSYLPYLVYLDVR